MSPDPRLPRFTETGAWVIAFIQRFYRLWSELATFLDSITPQYGTWTPVLTFGTPGTLAVTYSVQQGGWTRIGKKLALDFTIVTSGFTLGTATGSLMVTGLPLPPANVSSYEIASACEFSGITKAGYGSVFARASATSTSLTFDASGSAVAAAVVTATDTPTGGTIVLRGSITYRVD